MVALEDSHRAAIWKKANEKNHWTRQNIVVYVLDTLAYSTGREMSWLLTFLTRKYCKH